MAISMQMRRDAAPAALLSVKIKVNYKIRRGDRAQNQNKMSSHSFILWGEKKHSNSTKLPKLTPSTRGCSFFCVSVWFKRQDPGSWDQIAYVIILVHDLLAG